ncbi:hypothetical protein ACSX1A_09825 [Pontibacter sp. MBLB2868]|uniref:hypothetical protein n=1 Tax=Pontibacter sp. MBLB2868 TaxID=3451555 RepID=UPI003F74F24D
MVNREMFDRREIHLLPLVGTNEGQAPDTPVPSHGQTRHPETGSLLIYKNDISNDNRNGGTEWSGGAHPSVKNNSFSFSNGATPSVEQVRACMQELPDTLTAGLDLVEESRKFYVNYSANGWVMGSAKMRSLLAAVEKWITMSHIFNQKQNRIDAINSPYSARKRPFKHLEIRKYEGTQF